MLMLRPSDFKTNADPIIAWIDHYLNNLADYPVKSGVSPGEIYERIPHAAPEEAQPMEAIVKDMDELIMPGITHWQHPNYHAYFPANQSVESVLAEFVTASIGAQCMMWDTSPAAAELEQRMMEWLARAMGLPGHMEGVIQDSASSATLAAILTAREVVTGFASNEAGVPPNLRVYCSSETHSSVEKAVGISGIGRSNLVRIPVDGQMRMIPEALESQLVTDKSKGLIPCAVVATLGTTGTLAVDPLEEIAAICHRQKVWLHVDAAYAGTALMLPEYRWMAKGMEYVDSFVFNPHKWMFTNFDCSAYFVKDATQLIKTFEILPEYLKTKSRGQVNDYRDWGVPLGRRFRALKLWFVLRSYGLSGIRTKLNYHLELTQTFLSGLNEIPHLQLVTKPFLNFCTFRFQPNGVSNADTLNELNEKILDTLNRRGRMFLTHTRVKGLVTMRMVIGQTYVDESHVERALGEIKGVSGEMLETINQ